MRDVHWIKAALKAFKAFPTPVKSDANAILVALSMGERAASVKRLKHMNGAVFEIVLRHRTDAFRVVYVTELDDAIWVVHAFQKKSKSGISTPKPEIDLIRSRLKRLKDILDEQ